MKKWIKGRKSKYFLPFTILPCCEKFLLTFALIVLEQIAGDPGGQSMSHQFQVKAKALSSIFMSFISVFNHFFFVFWGGFWNLFLPRSVQLPGKESHQPRVINKDSHAIWRNCLENRRVDAVNRAKPYFIKKSPFKLKFYGPSMIVNSN